jgi:hypothetical protein
MAGDRGRLFYLRKKEEYRYTASMTKITVYAPLKSP